MLFLKRLRVRCPTPIASDAQAVGARVSGMKTKKMILTAALAATAVVACVHAAQAAVSHGGGDRRVLAESGEYDIKDVSS
jgi:hypothetical protein